MVFRRCKKLIGEFAVVNVVPKEIATRGPTLGMDDLRFCTGEASWGMLTIVGHCCPCSSLKPEGGPPV
jgi:hypothetical protein